MPFQGEARTQQPLKGGRLDESIWEDESDPRLALGRVTPTERSRPNDPARETGGSKSTPSNR